MERRVYLDMISLRNVPLVLDSHNQLGFVEENLVGQARTVRVFPGMSMRIKITHDLRGPDGETADGAADVPGRKVYAKVKFNPSRLVHPDPVDGYMRVGDAHKVLGEPVTRLFEHLGVPGVDLLAPGIAVTGLHLARDFSVDVAVADLLKEILASEDCRVPYRKLGKPRRGPINQLEANTQYYGIKLYDQKQRHGPDHPTDVRCELQMRRGRYSTYWDVRDLSRITADGCTRVLHRYFEHAGFGATTSAGRLDFNLGELAHNR